MEMRKAVSTAQKADIFTKCFEFKEWKAVRRSICILTPEERETLRRGEGTWMPYMGEENVKVPYLETAKHRYEIDWGLENYLVDSDDEHDDGKSYYEEGYDEFDPWNDWDQYDPEEHQVVEGGHDEHGVPYMYTDGVDVPYVICGRCGEQQITPPICTMRRRACPRAELLRRQYEHLLELVGQKKSKSGF